jgi:hypothetical protein
MHSRLRNSGLKQSSRSTPASPSRSRSMVVGGSNAASASAEEARCTCMSSEQYARIRAQGGGEQRLRGRTKIKRRYSHLKSGAEDGVMNLEVPVLGRGRYHRVQLRSVCFSTGKETNMPNYVASCQCAPSQNSLMPREKSGIFCCRFLSFFLSLTYFRRLLGHVYVIGFESCLAGRRMDFFTHLPCTLPT